MDTMSVDASAGMAAPSAGKAEWLADTGHAHNTEAYDHVEENAFLNAMQHPKSTFSIDVDTASYSNVRRILQEGNRPPTGAVRIEEMVNYFSYDYPQPADHHPFSVSMDVAPCPWQEQHELVRVALQARKIEMENRPASNLVFLLDVSGSMRAPNKLPLVQSAMRLLLEQLDERDRVAIVVYAGATGLALPSTTADQQTDILAAINELRAGGSTNGSAGINLAYELAEENFIPRGVNRVILCTDGDFNVGATSQSSLIELIQAKAKSNVFLSVFGFGSGNLKDSTMEKLADKGNGNYGYIDSLLEARKTLVQQVGGTLITIAKDVKIQLDFNPQQVAAYRLIGYENRLLANQDFADDSKDAGEIGAGHSVTALYEIIPPGVATDVPVDSPSKFVETTVKQAASSDTMLTVSLRYKAPDENESTEFTQSLERNSQPTEAVHQDFRFAAAVASFGMMLRDSKYKGNATWDAIIRMAEESSGEDERGFRAEFIMLAKKARMISG